MTAREEDVELARVDVTIPVGTLEVLRELYPPEKYPNDWSDADRIREAVGEGIRGRKCKPIEACD